ncbi:MAG TPA: UDP-N-acetylmuramate dehydrogenase [Alcanivoracaceae bacterium]|nr:UDP-N-acetylmuramate dehydrogenase [Alcanivoracaceae bacterium]
MITPQYPLQTHNTLRLHSQAQWFAAPTTEAELLALLQEYAPQHAITVLGGGSNVVLAEYLPGLVVHPCLHGKQCLRQEAGKVWVAVSAGEEWDQVVAWTLAQGWQGLENLSLIPGHCGAAPVQNIGAYGVELADVLESVTAIHLATQEKKVFSVEECEFAYRDSYFKSVAPGEWLITELVLRLNAQPEALKLGYGDVAEAFARLPEEEQHAEGLRQVICAIRSAKLPDPKQLANAGSFFKNPVVAAAQHATLKEQHPNLIAYPMPDGQYKLAAGWLIEQAGWKGHQPDGIGMHSQQALVMVNHRSDAVAADVEKVAEQVKASVWRQFGVHLEQEPLALPRVL